MWISELDPDPVLRFLLITPPDPDLGRLLANLPALRSYVDAVVLRWPRISARRAFEMSQRLAQLPQRPALLVGDRLDIALASGADGVHLREAGLPVAIARRCAPQLQLGASRHDEAGVRSAQAADYVTVSPVFSTASKPGAAGLGTDGLRRLSRCSQVPVLALGGVDAARVQLCRNAGAQGVAVLSAVWGRPDPVKAAQEIRAALDLLEG